MTETWGFFFSVILGEDLFAQKNTETKGFSPQEYFHASQGAPTENDEATGTVLEKLSLSISISHFLQV